MESLTEELIPTQTHCAAAWGWRPPGSSWARVNSGECGESGALRRDLGAVAGSKLNMSQQHALAAQRTNHTLGCTRPSTAGRWRKVLSPLLCAASPPVLGVVWVPLYKKDIKLYMKEKVVILLKLHTGYLDALSSEEKETEEQRRDMKHLILTTGMIWFWIE